MPVQRENPHPQIKEAKNHLVEQNVPLMKALENQSKWEVIETQTIVCERVPTTDHLELPLKKMSSNISMMLGSVSMP